MLYSIYYFLESVLSLFLVFVVGTINIYLFIYLFKTGLKFPYTKQLGSKRFDIPYNKQLESKLV